MQAGLQTFDKDGKLSFDSNRSWVRVLDKLIMREQPLKGSKTYDISFGKIAVAPFSMLYDSDVRGPFWHFTVNATTVNWSTNGIPKGTYDVSYAFVLWVD